MSKWLIVFEAPGPGTCSDNDDDDDTQEGKTHKSKGNQASRKPNLLSLSFRRIAAKVKSRSLEFGLQLFSELQPARNEHLIVVPPPTHTNERLLVQDSWSRP